MSAAETATPDQHDRALYPYAARSAYDPGVANENRLLAHIRGRGGHSAAVSIPPGDDVGGVRLLDSAGGDGGGGGGEVLVTVDQLADGVHFDLATHSLAQIARKAVTRNLSDVAAMAARPVAAVAAACLPRDFTDDRATRLFDAMHHTAAAFDCPLIGGDIATWEGRLLLSVTVLATPAGIDPVLRSGAGVGDAIYVTGKLGGSLMTLGGRTHHLDFTPRLAEARALAQCTATRPTAMMDLSDGLAQDLVRLCEASGVAAEVDAARLPIGDATRAAAAASGREAWRHAVSDGEDYELLFTAGGLIPDNVGDTPITRIGRIVAHPHGQPRAVLRVSGGEVVTLEGMGWEHR